MPTHWSVAPGQRVVDFEGTPLGTVRSVGTRAFEMEQQDGSRLWVRKDAIYESSPQSLQLICYRFGLQRWSP
jgi:hypothetical protein